VMLKTTPKAARSGPKARSLSETTLSDAVEVLPRSSQARRTGKSAQALLSEIRMQELPNTSVDSAAIFWVCVRRGGPYLPDCAAAGAPQAVL
jgi:hypothetical protein